MPVTAFAVWLLSVSTCDEIVSVRSPVVGSSTVRVELESVMVVEFCVESVVIELPELSDSVEAPTVELSV